VRAALNDAGVVVSNLWTANADYESMVATYDVVFGDVHRLRVPRRRQIILVAGPRVDGAERDDFISAATTLQTRRDLGFDLRGLVTSGYGRAEARGPVLVD
jgi:hypothetical protein